jgi:hypothetical protein
MKIIKILCLCYGIFFLAACATNQSSTGTTDLPFSEKLQSHPQDARALLYRNEAAPKKQYSKFIIEPVQIYPGENHGFGDLPKEDLEMMADFILQEMKRVLGEKYTIVDRQGPDTLRIKLILVGLEKTNTVMRSLTYGNPIGVISNLGKGVAGKEGNYLGSITLAGEFEDVQSGIVIAAFMGKIHPFALDLSFSPWAAAKDSVTRFAKDFRDTIDRK